MSHNSFTAEVQGVADIQKDGRPPQLQRRLSAKYGDAAQYDFRPPQMVTLASVS